MRFTLQRKPGFLWRVNLIGEQEAVILELLHLLVG
jgi:hypothetical protein